jgi:hypothetical protein
MEIAKLIKVRKWMNGMGIDIKRMLASQTILIPYPFTTYTAAVSHPFRWNAKLMPSLSAQTMFAGRNEGRFGQKKWENHQKQFI